MLELLVENLPYTLMAAGLVLMALEAISPGAHLIVIGVALVGAGLFGLAVGSALGGTTLVLALAAVTLVIGAGATWVYREFDFYGGKGTAQTSDSSALAGRTGYVTETVTTRNGKVKLEDGGFNPHYSARTMEGTIEEGEEVIVLDPGGGNVVTVQSMEELERDGIDRELARDAARQAAEDGDAPDVASESDRADEEPATETENAE